jgi:hypothetical protein
MLTQYEGSCTIDEPRKVIEKAIILCDHLVVRGLDITIRSSRIRGWVDVDLSSARLTLEDSEVDAGDSRSPAVGFRNLTVRRSEISGGQTSVQCSDCLIEDSLLHDQMTPVGDQHLNGYLSSGGSNVILRHNSIACTPENNDVGGGCTGSMQIFGDFEPLRDFRFERNFIRATPGGFCASLGQNDNKRFGKNPTGIVVIDNIFERGRSGKCGVWGATTSFFVGGKGNLFAGNIWDDGAPLQPNS